MFRHLAAAALALAFVPVSIGAQDAPQWRLVERWRSGGDSALGITFEMVVDMTRAQNGQLLVLIGGARQQLVIVDNTGRPVGFATGEDGLPIRFDKPNGVVQFPDGRIVVNEPEAGRLAVLDERARFQHHVPYEPWGYFFRWTGFVHDDGGLYEPVVHEGQLSWRRWAPDLTSSEVLEGAPCDLGMVRASPAAVYDIRSPYGDVTMPVPFVTPPVAIVRAADGGTWTGLPPDYRHIVHTPWQSCEDDMAITLTGAPQPITPDEFSAASRRVRQAALSIGAAVPDLSRIPTVHPLFTTLHLDHRQRLWVHRATEGAQRAFSVFDQAGRLVAEASIAEPLDVERPVVFGDTEITYFTTDEQGWVWLVGLQIERVDG